ncbi:MAG: hypothetical protein HHJ12_18570 [Glaciimonas sp.]|nr:hypothetical protein [Glaciimonas sp.]
MNNNDLPSISALPKGENSWRIDWFGDLAFPNRSIRRTQPSLFLYLSRVLDSNYRDDPSVLLSPDSTTPAKFQRKAWVSVGTLPLLRIGDIWCDGRLETRPDYELESFADLRIDDTTVHLIKAGLNLDDKGFLLPLSEHPWHMQCTHSYCVMVDLPDDRRLIIPCVELIRFYFGSSSSLVTKLFLPPLERKALYCNPKFDKANGRLVLELAEKISGASAADIGRLHLDPVAWRAAVHVGTSALKASLSNQHVYPQAFFPFEGNTTLIAAGRWLSFGEKPQATFIVYNLRSCSHPFPYHSLRYESKDNLRCPAQGGPSEPTQSAKRGHQSARDSRNQHLVEQDASNGLVPKIKQIRFEPRFPDLKKKTVWKNKSLSSPDASQSLIGTTAPPIDRVAIGEPGSERRIRSMDLAILSRPKSDKQPVPEFLREAVKELMQLQGLHIELLTESEEDGWTIPVTMLSNEDGEIDLRLFVDENADDLRLRRTSVFALRRDQEHLSVVFIEASPVHMKFYSTTGNDPEEIWQTLRYAARDFIYRRESENIAELINWVFENGID